MYEWFYHPKSEFLLFSTVHLITIGMTAVLILALYYLRRQLRPYRKNIRITIGLTLIVSRLSLDYWYIHTGQWTLSESLPLQLCSISSILCAVMLLTKNRHLFDIFYFIGIGGAMQAVLTPDLGQGFPHYRYIQFFLAHTLIVLSPLVLCWLYQFKITYKSLIKSFLALNGIALVVYFVNLWLPANYMFLIHKPESASLLDFLGPYPYYILSLEAVALLIFSLLYLPFVLNKPN